MHYDIIFYVPDVKFRKNTKFKLKYIILRLIILYEYFNLFLYII